MKRNKIAAIFLSCLFTFSACAQEHKQNEARLKSMQSIINATVVLNNANEYLPISKLAQKKFVSVNLGYEHQLTFDSLLNKYADVKSISANKYKDSTTLNDLEDDLKFFSTVFISVTDQMTKNERLLNFIYNTAKHKEVIVTLFGNGKSLDAFDNLNTPVVWCPQHSEEAAMVTPQIIFGGIAATQTLKIGFSGKYTVGSGYKTAVTRLKYTVPEDAGVNTENLKEIDKIAAEAIANKAAPGIVVLVAKDGAAYAPKVPTSLLSMPPS